MAVNNNKRKKTPSKRKTAQKKETRETTKPAKKTALKKQDFSPTKNSGKSNTTSKERLLTAEGWKRIAKRQLQREGDTRSHEKKS